MQIKHVDGKIRLYDIRLFVSETAEYAYGELTEKEVEQLLEQNCSILKNLLNEAKEVNARKKQEKINQLKDEIKKIEDSMRPVPIQQPKKEIR